MLGLYAIDIYGLEEAIDAINMYSDYDFTG